MSWRLYGHIILKDFNCKSLKTKYIDIVWSMTFWMKHNLHCLWYVMSLINWSHVVVLQ